MNDPTASASPPAASAIEAAHREPGAWFRALASASADVVYRVSRGWDELRQLDGQGLPGATAESRDEWLRRCVHPDDRATVSRAMDGAVGSGETLDVEHRVLHPDGSLAWTSLRAVPVLDDAGAPIEWICVTTDATARLQAASERERLLREADVARAAADLERRRLIAILDQLPVGVHVAEAPDGRLLFDNAAIRSICGESPRSERVADYSADYAGYFPPGHARAGERLTSADWPLARTLATARAVEEELIEIRRADDTRRLVRISGAPVLDADGRLAGAVATCVDMTDREVLRADEHAARERAERLQALSAALAAVATPEEVATAVVHHATEAFGAVGTVLARLSDDGETLEILAALDMPPEAGEDWRRFPVSAPVPLAEVIRTREPVYLESRDAWAARYPHVLDSLDAAGHAANAIVPLVADGRALGVLGAAFTTPRRFADADRAQLLAIARQCTQALERARLFEAERVARAASEAARAQVEHQVRLFEGIAGTTPDFVYLFDREGRFVYANRRLLEVWGLSLADAMGHTCLELGYEQWHHDMHMREIAQVLRNRQPITGEVPFRAPLTGIFGVYEYIFTPVLDADGEVTLVAGTTRDVTARKQAEAERERLLADAEAARAEAESANRAKGEFLAVMSHELRTPLNAIGGYAELLEMGIRGPVTPQQSDDLRRIQSSQRHLLGLINEVLNYAKLETGTVHYALADVRLREAIAAAEALVAPQARAKGLVLEVADVSPRLAARADAEKLRQVLVNLLSNAVKFTDRGGRVTLSCSEAGASVRLVVSDAGIGIAADQLARIFEPFVQVRSDLTRPHEGTGLGLAISRDLARGMGGDLTVESEPGVGSIFTVTLPRA